MTNLNSILVFITLLLLLPTTDWILYPLKFTTSTSLNHYLLLFQIWRPTSPALLIKKKEVGKHLFSFPNLQDSKQGREGAEVMFEEA